MKTKPQKTTREFQEGLARLGQAILNTEADILKLTVKQNQLKTAQKTKLK